MSTGIWSVEPNYCDCHPETCCCNPWVLLTPESIKHSSYFKKSEALEVAEAMNAVVAAKRSEVIAYLVVIEGERILTFEEPTEADNCESITRLVAATK